MIAPPRNPNLLAKHTRDGARPRILLPPGLGDCHWVILKLRDFLSKHCAIAEADVWLWDMGGPRRSAEFIQRVPFLRFVDYMVIPRIYGAQLRELCRTDRTVISNYCGFDFAFALNGWMELGKPIDNAMGSEPEWDYPILEAAQETAFALEHRAKGPWILTYFSALLWANELGVQSVRNLLTRLEASFPGHRILQVGLPWDSEFADKLGRPREFNMCGQTDPDEYFALLRGCDGMVGFANGNTILTTYFGRPTVMVWNRKRYPNSGFRSNWVQPGAKYSSLEMEDFSPGRAADDLLRLTGGFTENADWNAAINIKAAASCAEALNACGDPVSPDRKSPLGSLNQESA